MKVVDYLGDYDWMIILDACRYDCFIKLWKKGKTEPRLSLASDTLGTLKKMPEIPDSVLITGHPFPLQFKDKFTHVIDAGFDYDISTCPPEYIVREVIKSYIFISKFKRKILWFIQPHHPYLGKTRFELRIYDKNNPSEMTPVEKSIEAFREAKRKGILEKAYMDNLEYVLSYVKKLLGIIKGKIVITSDHAEGLGKPLRKEDSPVLYHPPDCEEWEVRVIPYCVFSV